MVTALSERLTKFVKKNDYGDNMLNSRFGKVTEWLPTRSRVINAAISSNLEKGVPVGKTIMFAGPTSSGKTQMALSVIKEAERLGYTIIYWDSEFAAEENIFKEIGVHLENVIHIPMAELEDIKTAFMKMDKEEIKEGDKVLHIFDSMGAWLTEKTISDAADGKTTKDMTIPGSKKGLMTLINQACGKKHMGAIIINHSYINLGGFGTSTIVAGGGALYMPSVILEFLTKKQWKDNKDNKIGNIFTFTIKKSRLSKEGMKEQFAMSNEYGISKYFGLLEYAIDGKFVIETKHGRSSAIQLALDVEKMGEDKAPKYLLSDLVTLYETDVVFGRLINETHFSEYIKRKFSYGIFGDPIDEHKKVSEDDYDKEALSEAVIMEED